MAEAARLIEGASLPVVRARFSPLKPAPESFPWHTAKWTAMPSRLLWAGDRRMEAENYLSSGYGIRLAIERSATGWAPLGSVASVWQPSRLKGIQLPSSFGMPFLAATQVFDVRPIARKWLSLDQTPDNAQRLVTQGIILLTCSGAVGRATLAFQPHTEALISHDLLRIDANDKEMRGWIYAYLRAPSVRQIMVGSHYGHVIKHLEVSHVSALPVPEVSDKWQAWFNRAFEKILEKRNAAHARTLESERLFEEAVTPLRRGDSGESGFDVRASALVSGRRRLDALPHNPVSNLVRRHLAKHSERMDTLVSAGFKLWLPNRFKRIPAEDGVGLLESSSFFEINPDVEKRIVEVPGCGVQNGWLLVARSGQLYGLIGSVAVATKQHEGFMVSDDILRVAPMDVCTARTGYVFVALTHPQLGRPLVKACAYGSSIPHIDPADLAELPLARLPKPTEDRIADLAEDAAALRSTADILENQMASEADRLIEAFIAGDDPAASQPPVI